MHAPIPVMPIVNIPGLVHGQVDWANAPSIAPLLDSQYYWERERGESGYIWKLPPPGHHVGQAYCLVASTPIPQRRTIVEGLEHQHGYDGLIRLVDPNYVGPDAEAAYTYVHLVSDARCGQWGRRHSARRDVYGITSSAAYLYRRCDCPFEPRGKRRQRAEARLLHFDRRREPRQPRKRSQPISRQHVPGNSRAANARTHCVGLQDVKSYFEPGDYKFITVTFQTRDQKVSGAAAARKNKTEARLTTAGLHYHLMCFVYHRQTSLTVVLHRRCSCSWVDLCCLTRAVCRVTAPRCGGTKNGILGTFVFPNQGAGHLNHPYVSDPKHPVSVDEFIFFINTLLQQPTCPWSFHGVSYWKHQ